jgi:hypothetical protein
MPAVFGWLTLQDRLARRRNHPARIGPSTREGAMIS